MTNALAPSRIENVCRCGDPRCDEDGLGIIMAYHKLRARDFVREFGHESPELARLARESLERWTCACLGCDARSEIKVMRERDGYMGVHSLPAVEARALRPGAILPDREGLPMIVQTVERERRDISPSLSDSIVVRLAYEFAAMMPSKPEPTEQRLRADIRVRVSELPA